MCASILRRSEQTNLNQVAAGDWNWKPSYDPALASNWKDIPSGPTVREYEVRPTRCITTAESACEAQTHDLIGIPHHKAVMYHLEIPVLSPKQTARLQRCALFTWDTAPTEEQSQASKNAADVAGPSRGSNEQGCRLRTSHQRGQSRATKRLCTDFQGVACQRRAQGPRTCQAKKN